MDSKHLNKAPSLWSTAINNNSIQSNGGLLQIKKGCDFQDKFFLPRKKVKVNHNNRVCNKKSFGFKKYPNLRY